MHLPHKKYPSEYWTFLAAKYRCTKPSDPRYKDYGGRGIQFNYTSFDNFFNDVGPKPGKGYSLDRIDNNSHYESGNCRWATHREQAINRSDNKRVTLNGETKTLVEWCEELNLPYGNVQYRLQAGWSVEDAFFKPINAHMVSAEAQRKIRQMKGVLTSREVAKTFDITGTTVCRIWNKE